MFKMEKLLARASKESGDTAGAGKYEALASARQKAVKTTCGMKKEGWYADYDLRRRCGNQLTAAALFPLYVKAAAQDRADKVASAAASHLLNRVGFQRPPCNWPAMGCAKWLGTAAMGCNERLQNYGQNKVAMDVTWRFLKNVQHTYDREQKLVEKYDVSTTGTGWWWRVPAAGWFWLE